MAKSTTPTPPAGISPRQKRLELEIGGKVRPLLFDNAFYEILTREMPLDEINNLSAVKPWRFVPTLVRAALQSAAEFENKKDTFPYELVAQWVEELEDAPALKQVVDVYRTSLGFIYRSFLGWDPTVVPEKPAGLNP